MSTGRRAAVVRVLVFLVLAVAAQWMLRLGAREGSLVEWDCYGGECSTNDFAGAAPVLGAFLMFGAAFTMLPAGRKHLMFGIGLFLSAGTTLVGLEEGVATGLIERDGPSGFFLFGGTRTATVEIIMAGLAGVGLVMVAVLLIIKPQTAPSAVTPSTRKATTDADVDADTADTDDARTARVIAQLTKLREAGELDQATYDAAVAKLLR